MVDTVRTAEQLKALYTDAPQSISFQTHRDFVESTFGVGASEADTGVTPTSVETGKGLERLGGRRFRVLPGGDGIYKFDAIGTVDIDIEANVNVAILKNDIQSGEGAPDFVLQRRMYPGGKREATNFIYLYEIHSVVENDIIELQFQEGGGANVSDVDYVFTGFRIG